MEHNLNHRQQLMMTIILGILSAAAPLAIDLYLPALPEMMQHFHSSASLMQLSITAYLLGSALGQLMAGILSDRYGRKITLIVGFALFTLSSLAIAFISSVTLLIGLRFFQGIAGASGSVVSRAVARDLFEGKQLTSFYAILNSINGIFPIIAPIIGGFMIRFVPWQGIFVLLAIIGLILTVAILFYIPETLAIENRVTGGFTASFEALGHLLKQPVFLILILMTGLIYASLFGYISASAFVFQQDFHLSAQAFSLLYALNGLGIVFGSNLPSRLSRRYSDRQQLQLVLSAAVLVATFLAVTLLFPHNLFLVAIPVWLIVFLIGALLTLSVSIIMNRATNNAGSASALIGLSQNVFGSTASPIAGLFGTGTYAPMAFIILGSDLLALGLFHTIRTKLS